MVKPLLIACAACLTLAGCSSIEYQPFVGSPQVKIGSGGAMQKKNDVELWNKGAPDKPFIIVGYIDGEYDDDWPGEDMMIAKIVKKVKEVGGNGVIRLRSATVKGDAYVVGNSVVQDGTIQAEYVVFKYVEVKEQPEPDLSL